MPKRFVRAPNESRKPATPAASSTIGQYLDSTIVRERRRRRDHAIHGERNRNHEHGGHLVRRWRGWWECRKRIH